MAFGRKKKLPAADKGSIKEAMLNAGFEDIHAGGIVEQKVLRGEEIVSVVKGSDGTKTTIDRNGVKEEKQDGQD